MEKILITGATGFIGKHLLKLLLEEQFAVRALIRNQQQSTLLPSATDCFIGDLSDPKSLIGVCDNIDTVFHLGGYAHAWDEKNSSFADQHHTINYLGTKNVLEEALRAKVKSFIYFSTVKAVADSEKYIDESWEEQPNSPYGIAKRKAEKFVLEHKRDMHVCVLRPALVYGPQWKGNLAAMLRAIDRGIFLPLPETHNQRSLVSINDVCKAAILAVRNLTANGKIYFVTDGTFYSTRRLYVAMCHALGRRIPSWHVPLWFFKVLARIGDLGTKITRRRLPFSSDALTKLFGSAQYSSQRIQQDLHFKAGYDLEKMLPEIISAYRKQPQ